MEKQIYNLTKEEIFKKFNTSQKGLTSIEALARLKQYGKNTVQKKQNWSWLLILWRQFNDALVWILLVAASLSFVFGEIRDTVIILLIISINSFIGFFQEYKAEKTLENIRKLETDKAVVLRDGQRQEIDAIFLVPGDIIFLAPGDSVAADAYLIEGYDIYANEFIFTGESKAGKKNVGAIKSQGIILADMDNMIFMGSSLTRGNAMAVVTQTGMKTQLGHIAHLVTEVKEDETPLQKQMRKLGRMVSILAIFIATSIMVAGYYMHTSLYENFLFALALAVSVVPEGLPAAISVALSLGMKKLLKHNVLAKKLNAVETLASVNIICTDKTGTITRNELMVTNIISGSDVFTIDGQGYQNEGYFHVFGRRVDPNRFPQLEELLTIGVLCNDSAISQKDKICSITGDPTEGALLVVARKYNQDLKFFSEGLEKINEIPFSSEKMRMSVIYKNIQTNEITSFVKGSPDVLIDLCSHIKIGNQILEFSAEEKQKAKDNYNEMSRQALRVLAFASHNLSEFKKDELLKNADNDLVWYGMMGMIDPPRIDVHKAIDDCIKSGIKVIMITGDYEVTAYAIAKKVGLLNHSNSQVINGKNLDNMTDQQIMEKINSRDIAFARIAPEQKLRIATLLKKKWSCNCNDGRRC